MRVLEVVYCQFYGKSIYDLLGFTLCSHTTGDCTKTAEKSSANQGLADTSSGNGFIVFKKFKTKNRKMY